MGYVYSMKARDVDSASLTYRTWVAANAPDFAASQYTGPKSGGSPLADVTVSSAFKSPIPDGTVPNFSVISFLTTGSSPAASAASRTVGVSFRALRNCRILGVRVWWATPNVQVKISVWNSAGTRLTSDVMAVTTAGLYAWSFSTPQSMTAVNEYTVSAWQTDGVNYTSQNSAIAAPALPFNASPYVQYTSFIKEQTGDAFPNTTSAGVLYPVEPALISS